MVTKEKFKKILLIFVLLFITLPLLLPLFKQGMFVSDDANWMIIRLSDFHRSFADGQFPVRWGSRLNFEYGYPVYNFLYPGVYYLGEIVHLFKFNFVNSIKILFGLSIFCSVIFSFKWLQRFFENFSAFIGSLIYIYFPYHVFDIYKRCSLGEAIAFSFLPLVLWAIEKNNN